MSLILNVASDEPIQSTHCDELWFLIVEFERRFEYVELVRPRINLFNNPTAVENEDVLHFN